MTGEFFSKAIVVFLTLGLLQELRVTLRNDLLQITPSVFQSFHGEPSVWVGSDFETLDFGIESSQRFEINLGR